MVWSTFISRAVEAALLLVFVATTTTTSVLGQSASLCDGEPGQAEPWVCDALAPIPQGVFEEFLPLPGKPDAANPVKYKQIAGESVVFGAARDHGKAAVFVLTEGTYMCMVAESNGEAALFDAPEGSFVSSAEKYPTGSWLGESIKAILGEGTRLKYIVYSHTHWDHIGAAGLVARDFAADEPMAISSNRNRRTLKRRSKRDPTSVFGNNRGVPVPDKWEQDFLDVGGLRFELNTVDGHEDGSWLIFLDKNKRRHKRLGIATSVAMVVDIVFPGWSAFYSVALATDIASYYESLDEIYEYDFDVLVGGHLTRLGTKEDVQVKIDFYADVLAGSEAGLAAVSVADVATGIEVFDPTTANAGNLWLLFNEVFEAMVDVCVEYVLDVPARERDWTAELAAVDVMLRSQCWAVQEYIRIG